MQILTDITTPQIVESMISQLDTGIFGMRFKEVDMANLDWPADLVDELTSLLVDEGHCVLIKRSSGMQSAHFHVVRVGDKLKCHAWQPVHEGEDGSEEEFEIVQESTGTRRLFDLLPVLHPIYAPDTTKVFILDDLGQSMHTSLTRSLITQYLDGRTKDSRAQLVLTTHDALIMNENFLRWDEIWLTQRRGGGGSHLYSVYNFKKTKTDKDVRKTYMSGFFGGTPDIYLNTYNLHHVGELREEISK